MFIFPNYTHYSWSLSGQRTLRLVWPACPHLTQILAFCELSICVRIRWFWPLLCLFFFFFLKSSLGTRTSYLSGHLPVETSNMIDVVLEKIHIARCHTILTKYDMVLCIASNLDCMSYNQQLYENMKSETYAIFHKNSILCSSIWCLLWPFQHPQVVLYRAAVTSNIPLSWLYGVILCADAFCSIICKSSNIYVLFEDRSTFEFVFLQQFLHSDNII